MGNGASSLTLALFLWSCRTFKSPKWVFRGVRHFLFAFLVTVTLVSPTLVSIATVTNVRFLNFLDFGKVRFFPFFVLISSLFTLFSLTFLAFLILSTFWPEVVQVG